MNNDGAALQGELGPSTIVGSASFNLFVIVAICVVAIPADDARIIKQLPVYAVTATGSLLAYAWLLLILLGTSPEMITPGEAVLTLLFMPLFVGLAYMADRWPQVLFGAISPAVPAAVFGVSSLLAVGANLMLPETRDLS